MSTTPLIFVDEQMIVAKAGDNNTALNETQGKAQSGTSSSAVPPESNTTIPTNNITKEGEGDKDGEAMVSTHDEPNKEKEENDEQQPAPTLLQQLGRWIFWALVNFVVDFSVAVASHPAIQESAAQIIVKGINAFITQPDLNGKIQIMSDTMAKTQEDFALSAGQDFPKMMNKFMEGWRQEKQHQKEEKQQQRNATQGR